MYSSHNKDRQLLLYFCTPQHHRSAGTLAACVRDRQRPSVRAFCGCWGEGACSGGKGDSGPLSHSFKPSLRHATNPHQTDGGAAQRRRQVALDDAASSTSEGAFPHGAIAATKFSRYFSISRRSRRRSSAAIIHYIVHRLNGMARQFFRTTEASSNERGNQIDRDCVKKHKQGELKKICR